MADTSAPRIVTGYRPGLIGAVTALHARHYAEAAGFGCAFEAIVATGLAGFCERLEKPANAIWAVIAEDEILGSIAIDGEDLGGGARASALVHPGGDAAGRRLGPAAARRCARLR